LKTIIGTLPVVPKPSKVTRAVVVEVALPNVAFPVLDNAPVTASPVELHSLKIVVAAPPADPLIASVRTPGLE
jgi:hypothetical protein